MKVRIEEINHVMSYMSNTREVDIEALSEDFKRFKPLLQDSQFISLVLNSLDTSYRLSIVESETLDGFAPWKDPQERMERMRDEQPWKEGVSTDSWGFVHFEDVSPSEGEEVSCPEPDEMEEEYCDDTPQPDNNLYGNPYR